MLRIISKGSGKNAHQQIRHATVSLFVHTCPGPREGRARVFSACGHACGLTSVDQTATENLNGDRPTICTGHTAHAQPWPSPSRLGVTERVCALGPGWLSRTLWFLPRHTEPTAISDSSLTSRTNVGVKHNRYEQANAITPSVVAQNPAHSVCQQPYLLRTVR